MLRQVVKYTIAAPGKPGQVSSRIAVIGIRTSVPATVPLLVRVKVAVTTGSCNLWIIQMIHVTSVRYSVQKTTYHGSKADPRPGGWRTPPAVDPLISRSE